MTNGFEKITQNGVTYYAVSFLQNNAPVRAAFSTRLGGVSTGETATLNLSFRRRDTGENVQENYRRFGAAAGFTVESLAISRQVHGNDVLEVLPQDVGRGIFDEDISPETDGLMTDKPGVTLVKHSADCVSVYIVDPMRPAIALLHAGWRGTATRIAQQGLRRMAEVYGTRPWDCLCAIGPSIGPCCFEVGLDVAEVFDREFPGWGLVRDNHVDLWECNRRQLEEIGVPSRNIYVSELCTACDTETFFSHRAEKGKTGSMAAFLMLV